MDASLALVVVTWINNGASEIQSRRCITTLEVDKAEIRIVSGIIVNAFLIVGLGAIPVVVIRLAILRPAAHGSVGRTGGKFIRVFHTRLKVGQHARPLNTTSPGNALIESFHLLSVLLQITRCRLIGSFVSSLDLLLPISATVEKHLFEIHVSPAVGRGGEGHLVLCSVHSVAQFACIRETSSNELEVQVVLS